MESYKRSVRRISLQFKGRFSRDNISWRSALSSLWWVKIFLIRRQSVLFAKHLLCRHTPFKIKTLVSCIRFLLVFLCGCSLVRVTTRWWTLMVATHLLPLCLGESVFPWGFSVLSSPVLSLCSRSSRFATLGRGGSGQFRGDSFLCPLSFGSLSHCQLSHPLHLWISSHCWAKIYLCFRRLQRSKLCWLGRLKQFYFSY